MRGIRHSTRNEASALLQTIHGTLSPASCETLDRHRVNYAHAGFGEGHPETPTSQGLVGAVCTLSMLLVTKVTQGKLCDLTPSALPVCASDKRRLIMRSGRRHFTAQERSP